MTMKTQIQVILVQVYLVIFKYPNFRLMILDKCAYLSVEIIGNYDSNLVANETYNDFNSELNKWNSLPVYRKIKELLLHSTNLLSEAGFNMKFNTDKDKEDRWGTVGSISNIYSSDLDNSNSNDYDISDYDYTIEFNYDNNDSNFNQLYAYCLVMILEMLLIILN